MLSFVSVPCSSHKQVHRCFFVTIVTFCVTFSSGLHIFYWNWHRNELRDGEIMIICQCLTVNYTTTLAAYTALLSFVSNVLYNWLLHERPETFTFCFSTFLLLQEPWDKIFGHCHSTDVSKCSYLSFIRIDGDISLVLDIWTIISGASQKPVAEDVCLSRLRGRG